MTAGRRCAWCNEDLGTTNRYGGSMGRPARFCTDACRKAEHRRAVRERRAVAERIALARQEDERRAELLCLATEVVNALTALDGTGALADWMGRRPDRARHVWELSVFLTRQRMAR